MAAEIITDAANMDADDTLRRVITFARHFGEPHTSLAMHAAFPVGLTPEIVHLIRINFVDHAPWISEADLLLSPLCREAGGGVYEMHPHVRDLLLDELRSDPAFGQQRIKDLAELLLAYTARAGAPPQSSEARDFHASLRWVALAYARPEEAARLLAAGLGERLASENRAGVIRLANLAKTLTTPLINEQKVLLYAVGVGILATGNVRRADAYFEAAGAKTRPVALKGVILPAPAGLQSWLAPTPPTPSEENPPSEFTEVRPPLSEVQPPPEVAAPDKSGDWHEEAAPSHGADAHGGRVDYNRICFVIIPFGKKKVGDKEVDFDFIYEHIFRPAIESIELPEGGKLEPRRTDKDYFTGDISQDMFQYIEYSRFALADISGLNANVFYELGVRHRVHESGTAIFRQESGPMPFDIGQIKVFPYEYESEDKVAESIKLVRQVLAESLVHNRLDGPPMRALHEQGAMERDTQRASIEQLLIEADNALRNQDWTRAIDKFSEALAASPNNAAVLFKRGLIYRDRGMFDRALADFSRVTELSPSYAEAYREKGIVENKLYNKANDDSLPSGEETLLRALKMKADDFYTLSSLGGVYKRQGRMAEAAACYERATEISKGNTYPLLNAIIIKASAEGRLELMPRYRFMLNSAKRSLQTQVESGYNPPWSAFDLAQICLFTGDGQNFLDYLDEGMILSTHAWQPETVRKTLELLTSAGITLPGLDEGIQKLKEAEEFLT